METNISKKASEALLKSVANFASVEVASKVLPAGSHLVMIKGIKILHSFMKSDGTLKDKAYEWKTPNTAIALFFANKEGAVMTRYYLNGYKRYEDLTPKQKESDAYSNTDDGFAIKNNDRIVDADKSRACVEILSRVFSAAGLPAGSTIDDMKDLADEGNTLVNIVVEEIATDNGGYMDVVKVSKPKAAVDVTEQFN